jgi:hypothetical protein
LVDIMSYLVRISFMVVIVSMVMRGGMPRPSLMLAAVRGEKDR